MNYKKMSKRLLGKIEIETNKQGGFTLWTFEKDKNGTIRKHWVLDASCFRSDGEMRLGNLDNWNHNIVFDITTRTLKFIDKTKTK